MSKCEFCGEYINWNDPNMHYGGHTCDTQRLDKIGATRRYVRSIEQPYIPNKQKEEHVHDKPAPTSAFPVCEKPNNKIIELNEHIFATDKIVEAFRKYIDGSNPYYKICIYAVDGYHEVRYEINQKALMDKEFEILKQKMSSI